MKEFKILMKTVEGGMRFGLILKAVNSGHAANEAKHISQGCYVETVKELRKDGRTVKPPVWQ